MQGESPAFFKLNHNRNDSKDLLKSHSGKIKILHGKDKTVQGAEAR